MRGAQNGGIIVALMLAGCGGGSGHHEYQLSGTVTGLVGGLSLQSGTGETLIVTAAGHFAFSRLLPSGTAYQVVVSSPPAGQSCVVTQGQGRISANVTDVGVTCTATPLSLTASTPADGATDLEPVDALSLSFSTALASAPAASSVVKFAGANLGEAFSATYADNQIQLALARPLSLATHYSVDVSTALRGVGGGQLATPVSLGFSTRDGQWRAPQTLATGPFPTFSGHHLATDAAGNTIVVWSQLSGARKDLFASRYTAAGGWTAPVRIETDNAGDADFPRVAMDAAGNAIAVWIQSDGLRPNLWTNRFTPAGGWGEAQLVESENAGGVSSARLSMNAHGDAAVIWVQRDGSQDHVWVSRFRPASGWSTPTRLDRGNSVIDNPVIALGDNGGLFAVWQGGSSAVANVWASRYLAGEGWDEPVLLEDGATSATWPEIAVDDQGNALVVWMQNGTPTRTDIWSNRFVAGTGWTGAMTIESSTSGAAALPKIGVDARGNAIVVFAQQEGSSSNYRILATRFIAGTGWGTPGAIDEAAGQASLPQVGVDAQGNAIAVWFGTPGSGSAVSASRFLVSTGSWTPEEISHSLYPGLPLISMGASGKAQALWIVTADSPEGETELLLATRFD